MKSTKLMTVFILLATITGIYLACAAHALQKSLGNCEKYLFLCNLNCPAGFNYAYDELGCCACEPKFQNQAILLKNILK